MSSATTSEQLALRDARRLKRQQAKAEARAAALAAPPPPLVNLEKGQIVPRSWLTVQDGHQTTSRSVRIMTWNLLAQCLVRRELFPNSDCLKSAQREHMLFNEILSSDSDILCLQEVDRLEKLIPVLEEAKYGHVYAAGPRKRHGSLVAFRKDSYKIHGNIVICYDDIDIRPDGSESFRKGLSFRTKNVGNIVALEKVGDSSEGYIVATTHLFWHPSSMKTARSRQAGILLREVVKGQVVLCASRNPQPHTHADFNFHPGEPGYALLAGDALTPAQERLLAKSRVVHVSVDPSVPLTASAETNEDDESDPDRVITNAREAIPTDGLLSSPELVELFAVPTRPRSLYDEGQRLLEKTSSSILRCGERLGLPVHQRGAYEPEWTSYTHYWKSVLDYIWVIDPLDRRAVVTRLLQPHMTDNLEPGLPRMGICGSDHVSLAAEVRWEGGD
ncbi:Endonuclease/exonuclease/phosphatase [Lactarius hatsudake]|nr:Endonuclease/exonuclease/phosphatase [Lactarius hatsudake]